MCSQRDKTVINNVNRLFIGIASIIGMILDGFGSGDIMGISAMAIWLLQPECNALEQKLLDKIRRQAIS